MHVPPYPLFLQRREHRLLAALTASVFVGLLSSCASPGPPRPPSLHLPEVVTDLTAQRIGQEVHLRWTAPSHTTDGLAVSSPMVAEICRDPHPKPEAPRPQPKAGKATAAQNAPGCDTVLHLTVKPGANEADDRLPDALSVDPVTPLAYRIRMLNPQGRSAGFSRAVIAPSGSAPPLVTALRATATREGARIEWQPQAPATPIELNRTLVSVPAKTASQKKSSVSLPDDQPVEVRLRTTKEDAPANDPGGTLDRTAVRGQHYVYRAQRIRIVDVSGHRFELRGSASPQVNLIMADTFPPVAPTGLATIPGTQGNTPTIDLSWQPNTEADVAGYNVYRREGSAASFRRINDKPLVGPAFSDLTITAGTTYTYRVTAVDSTGNESPPSAETTETAVAH